MSALATPRRARFRAWPVLLSVGLAMTVPAHAQDKKPDKPKPAEAAKSEKPKEQEKPKPAEKPKEPEKPRPVEKPKEQEKPRPAEAPKPEMPKPAQVVPAMPLTPATPATVELKEPVAHRVYQRDREGKADIPIVVDPSVEGASVHSAQIVASIGGPLNARLEDGKLRGVPMGGPYVVTAQVQVGPMTRTVTVLDVYVGDLWILAGQSNMEGVGDLVDVTPPQPRVGLLGMDGQWSQAAEPLHWLVDSPDPVHSGDPADRAKRSAEQHRTRTKGAGLGLPFAAEMVRATGVPVGLVATAHGGTSMEQWDPAKRGEGGKSLYGSFLRQIDLAGGKVKGVLWYQGESDANPDAAKVYPKVFTDFIGAVRSDLGQPDLPFYFVQIGRFIIGGDPAPWNAVQDAERRLAESLSNVGVAATIDLELDDLIHVGTQGHKRLGRRLALIAQRELFGMPGGTTPTFDRVNRGPNNTLVVKFKGVNVASAAPAGQGLAHAAARPLGMGMGPDLMAAMQRTSTAPAGLGPSRHIGGFSIRKADGAEIPLIYDASVGPAGDTVVLKLAGPVPEKAVLWYGHGFDPYCNLVDGLDMAVPVFGPIPLDPG